MTPTCLAIKLKTESVDKTALFYTESVSFRTKVLLLPLSEIRVSAEPTTEGFPRVVTPVLTEKWHFSTKFDTFRTLFGQNGDRSLLWRGVKRA